MARSGKSSTPRPGTLTIRDPKVLATLYEPVRYRMFRALRIPRSVPEVAVHLGVPANGLYYHLRRLLEAGLVVQVATRASNKHTERVYAHAAERLTVGGDVRMEEAAPAVGALLADAFQELDDAVRAHQAGDFGEDPPGLFAWHIGSLTSARARSFERRFEALVAEFTAAERKSRASKPAQRYATLGVFTPLPAAPPAVRPSGRARSG